MGIVVTIVLGSVVVVVVDVVVVVVVLVVVVVVVTGGLSRIRESSLLKMKLFVRCLVLRSKELPLDGC